MRANNKYGGGGHSQSCTQIGRTVCLYTVLPDFQEKILLKRAVE